MSEERYTYAVARVRAKESTLLNKAALDQLLACKLWPSAAGAVKTPTPPRKC